MKNSKINYSLKNAAKILGILPKSLKRQLERGMISGQKDKDGYWIVTDQDIKMYKKSRRSLRNPPKNRITVTDVSNCLGMVREDVVDLIQEGILDAIQVQNQWWIDKTSYHNVLEVKANQYQITPIVTCRNKIKILNRNGLCLVASTEIIKFLSKYLACYYVFIHKDGLKWPVHNVFDLFKHEIKQFEAIDMQIEGIDPRTLMREIIDMSLKFFGLKR